MADTNLLVSDGTNTFTFAQVWTPTATKTGNYTASIYDVVRCDPSGGAFTVTLPSASGRAGKGVIVKNVTASRTSITCAGSGSETIDGHSGYVLHDGFASVQFVSDGTNWNVSTQSIRLDVRAFGARGDGVTDDTAAIQSAIDAIPQGTGVQTAQAELGGIVFIPAGKYVLNGTLVLPAGVILEGEYAGTLLYHTDTSSTSMAIDVQPGSLNFNWSSGVRNLSLYTAKGYGVSTSYVPTTSPFDLFQPLYENLIISAGNVAIYLPDSAGTVYTQNGTFRNILCRDCGGAALWVEGNANIIEQVETEGGGRSGFSAPTGMLVVKGSGNTVTGCIIEGVSGVVAYYCSGGSLNFVSNWAEVGGTLTDGREYVFENGEGVFSDIHPLLPEAHAYFNNFHATIQHLDISGADAPLTDLIERAGTSMIHILSLVARADAGGINDPYIFADLIFNQSNDLPVQDIHAPRTGNLLVNGDFGLDIFGWQVEKGDDNSITADVTVVDKTSVSPGLFDKVGKCLKIVVSDNPHGKRLRVYQTTSGGVANFLNSGSPLFLGYSNSGDQIVPLGTTNINTLGGVINTREGAAALKAMSAGGAVTFSVATSAGFTGTCYLSDCYLVAGDRHNFVPSLAAERQWANGRSEIVDTAAPTTGTWRAGDVVWNSSPSVGGWIGWTCVTGGTSGTWKGFGAIQSP